MVNEERPQANDDHVETIAPALGDREPDPGEESDPTDSDFAAHEAAGPGVSEPIAFGTWHTLSPRYVKFRRIIGSVALLMVFPLLIVIPLGVGLLASIGWLAALVPLAVLMLALASFWLAWIYPSLHHRHAAYRIDERQIEWRHGVWWRRVTVVPCSRVQHTDVSQNPLERRFGLGTLHIHTAGTEHAQVSIAGLEHARASWIRDHLVKGVGGDAV